MTQTARLWRSLVAATASAVVLIVGSPCAAQPKVDGVFALQTGAEGADPGLGQYVWQRARTRIALGAEWYTEHTFTETVALYGLIELERSGGFGAEVRYRRWMNRWLGGFVGVTAILQPESLLGATGGATATYGLGGKAAIFAELSASAFPLGTDLPHGDSVLTWISLGAGVRLGF